ncbi:MAG: 5'/3'-nucleotidase SurE [Gemmatimonadota bacterium]|nr:MAG: 5'/3'-nucleotidase SurE [Gemmatimonadota bacterium]
MRILITNDDGINARGLELLAQVSRRVGEVDVVAPDREQSGASHSLTLSRPLRPVRRDDGAYHVDGTPTDCVLLALGALLEHRPDFVLSGVNHGPNMGEDVLYSGTVAAAMEGLSLGIPGVAISLAGADIDLLPTHEEWLKRLLARIVGVREFPRDTLLNVNIPPIPGDQIRGIRTTTLGNRVYSESLVKTADPWGRTVYWIGGGQISWSGREDCDFRVVQEGYISVTPLHIDLTNYRLLEDVQGWKLGH